MAYTQVRVELHDGDGSDYDKLHSAMEKERFYRRFTQGGYRHSFPTGEYMSNDYEDPTKAMDAVKRAASSTRLEYEATLLVGEAGNSRDYNLKKEKL